MAEAAIGGGLGLAAATAADTTAASESTQTLTVQSTVSQAPHITDRPQLAFATVVGEKSTSRIPGGFFDEEQLLHVLTTAKSKSNRNRNDSNQLQAAMMASPEVEVAAGAGVALIVADGVSQHVVAAKQHPPKQQPAITTTNNNSTTDDHTCSDLASGYNDEKCDADPENSLKSGCCDPLSPADTATTTGDELSPIQSGGDQSPDQATAANAATDVSTAADSSVASVASDTSKSSLAFTIDFGDSNGGNGGASASGGVNNKKYNEIFERFQRRHQRGASMSKLEDAPAVSASPRVSKPPLRKAATASTDAQTNHPKVQLRDKSRLSRRDCSSAGSENRHSWSPRNSSAHPSTTGGCRQTMVLDEPLVLTPPPSALAARFQRKHSTTELAAPPSEPTSTQKTAAGFQPKSATLQMAFETIKSNFELSQQRIISPPNKPTEHEACEPAVEPIPCSVAPLEFRPNSACSASSSVSEAGTYTLDGDNYTEEQKEQMSIDKLAKLSLKTTDTAQTIQTSTGAAAAIPPPNETKAVGHGKSAKPKTTSYLERIKSKVRNISDRTFHKNQQHLSQSAAASRVSPEVELPPHMSQFAKLPAAPLQPPTTLDLGNFTSVTSAGAFSKQAAAVGCKPSTGRKPSLTKFQIDNSEYIQHQGAADDEAAHLNSFTDYEKSRHHDYQLNIFKTVGGGGEQAVAEATATTTSSSGKTESFGLGQAETKYDWIQEWAKNARRNTKKSASLDQAQTPSHQQSQSQAQHRPMLVNSLSTMAFECSPANGAGHSQTPSTNNANNSSSDFSDLNQSAVAHRRTMLEYHAQEANRYADDLQRLETQSSRRSRQASESPARMRKLQQHQQSQQQHRAAFSSTTSASEFGDEEDAHSEALSSPHHHQQQPQQQQQQRSHQHAGQPNSLADSYSSRVSRPPLSPSKIPSPMHSLSSRPRSASVNRSLHSSITDLDSMSHANDDTGMYLHKTAAAISQLQSIHHHHRHNSPQSPSSPQHQLYSSNGKIASNFQTSPSVRRHYKHSPFATLSPEHRLPPMGGLGGSPTHHSASHHGSSTSLHRAAQQQQQLQQHHQMQQQQIQQHLHRRNHSLDNAEQQFQPQQQQSHHQHMLGRRGSVTSVYRPTAATTTDPMSHSYNSEGLRDAFRSHSRHNSYDNDCSPSQSGNRHHHQQQQQRTIDQTFAPQIVKRTPISSTTTSTKAAAVAAATSASNSSKMRSKSANVTPSTIKRSSSFSTKPFVRPQSASNSSTAKATTPKLQQRTAPNGLQKSASSNSFKNMSAARYGGVHGGHGHADEIYLNDTDNLCAQNFSSESELSDLASPTQSNGASMASAGNSGGGELLTNTRYNKAFLARLEQNKPKASAMPVSSNASISSAGGAMSQSMSAAQQPKQGVIACPNTPELPRRDLRVRQSLRDRQSMPRDSSINRMKLDSASSSGSSSLAAAKRGLMEAAAAAAAATRPLAPGTPSASRVQPKYLDISKYKPQQGNTFLRRDESKSTLLPQHKEIKRSASSFGVGLGGGGGGGVRAETVGRSSVRSVKSAVSGNSGNSGGGRLATMSTSKDEATREADLAMWRRRASYDPMKAAAEGKRKLEAKKSAHANRMGENAPNGQSVGSGVVLRSQSYHSGVGQSAAATDGCGDHPLDDQAPNKRWTLISTESSDEDADQLPKY